MTDFFNYDDLTWNEVANLPRDTPLVLPLGSGYDHKQLLGVHDRMERFVVGIYCLFEWSDS